MLLQCCYYSGYEVIKHCARNQLISVKFLHLVHKNNVTIHTKLLHPLAAPSGCRLMKPLFMCGGTASEDSARLLQ